MDIIVRELEQLSLRFGESAQQARTLAHLTDWQSKAATAFHESADRWAADVAALGTLCDSAHVEAVRAQAFERFRLDRAAM